MKNDFLNFNPTLPERKSFIGTAQTCWDNTSLSALKTCPYKYYLSIVCGVVPMGESVHLKWGLLYHAAKESYDHAIARGASHEEGIIAAVRFALINSWEKRLNRPWISGHDTKNRHSLVFAIIDYYDNFNEKSENFETVLLPNGKPAVELSFNFEINYETPFGSPYKLSGHIDRLAKPKGEEGLSIIDTKTTLMPLNEAYWQQFSPNNQVSQYYFAGQIIFKHRINSFIIDATKVGKDKQSYHTEFSRREIPRSELQLEEWYKDLGYWLSIAETCSKQNYWPKNETACVKGYVTCEYIGICSGCPSTREAWLRSGWGTRVWDPIVAREGG